MAVAVAAPSPFLGGHTRQHARKSSSKSYIQNSVTGSSIKALFWGQRKASETAKLELSLGDFNLIELESEGQATNINKNKKVSVSVVSSISEISSDDWDACSLDASGPDNFNPFLSHGFLSALEDTGCAVKETGWVPQHIIARDDSSNILGVIPLYLKSHSSGEYVFDHSWADAYYSYGSRYYPKLQCCVPFTPVTGPRILVRNTVFRDQVFDNLVSALLELTVKFQVSSLHITFPSSSDCGKLKERGFLQRIGMQYHWKNHNYQSFDDFLMDMKQSKRKNIRQERKKFEAVKRFPVHGAFKISASILEIKIRIELSKKYYQRILNNEGLLWQNLDRDCAALLLQKISAQNLSMKRLRGYQIKAKHWDTFYKFYRNTTDNKWGSAYLTRDFFHNMASKMGDHVLLVTAEEGDELIAGALNLIGGDTLYGRLWGCLPRAYYPNLHFEACYYQAIDAAIELKLDKVEAGAQGEHKIQRGYLPVKTYSLHYILDEDFRKVISNFLVRESAQMEHVMKLLCDSGPFKDNVP